MKMRNRWVLLLVASFFLAVAGQAYGFEGRMAGMADPYGLIYDESDFLIHPSRMADGQGVAFYGFYKFSYTDVNPWSWRTPGSSAFGYNSDHMGVAGDQFDNDVLLGAAFPVGTGRLGLFFNYAGTRSDLDGDATMLGWQKLNVYDNADNFSFRAIYGVPLGGSMKLGLEAQVAYRTEATGNLKTYSNGTYSEILQNYLWDDFYFVRPHNYSYWDYQLKAGVQGDIGPATYGVTVRGGSIFSGNSEADYLTQASNGRGDYLGVRGDVEGYNVGSDIWLRYSVNERLALPFLIRIDYKEQSYNGGPSRLYSDTTIGSGLSLLPSYETDTLESKTDLLRLEMGGGADYTFPSGWKLAGGLYYGFIRTDGNLNSGYVFDGGPSDGYTYYMLFSNDPRSTEHQIKMKVAAEKPVNTDITVRAGLEAFHGWVTEDYNETYGVTLPNGNTYYDPRVAGSLTGSHWGILGSVGMTAKIFGVAVEPFVQAGWQRLKLDDSNAVVDFQSLRLERERECTMAAAGFAIKF
ncbi:MAG: hypothetical protein LLG06_04045 [Desulfobacteraceae bacterium]|nr:hypothetical protein [Desulfobacteraceae bacterium]